ncbi:hypothetical protein BGZ58_000453 [Dissophora ornata]|nr:hypothetical protein BGZ58_000453 [Dissophora ornata]
MRASVDNIRQSLKPATERSLARLESDMITEDEESLLYGILKLLEPARHFTDYVCSDNLPVMSDVYPRIRDMIDEALGLAITNPILVDFRDNLVQEMRRRWSLDRIPHNVTISTFLNPDVVNHIFFNDTIKINNDDVFMKDHARGLLLGALLAFKQVMLQLDESSQNGFNLDHWTEVFKREISRYEEKAAMEQHDFRTKPHEWWKSRGHCFSHLSHLARIYLSVQASSAASERLFSVAENILTAKGASWSDANFNRFLGIRNLHAFVTKTHQLNARMDTDDDEDDENDDVNYRED